MKKQEKIHLLQKGIAEKAICRCWFTYDRNYFYYYPLSVNDKFLLGQEEDDFQLDGYAVRKLSHLKKVEHKDDLCGLINRLFGIADQVCDPGIDISSWQSIFQSLSRLDVYLVIEDAIHEQFFIGVVEKVCRDRLYFRSFDADGIWDEAPLEIRYSQITSVRWGTRYARYWQRYLQSSYGQALCRIRRMEEMFDALQTDPAQPELLQELTDYYERGQWLRDYELDEQGLLPPDLKRGVLAQDAVFDFLKKMH